MDTKTLSAYEKNNQLYTNGESITKKIIMISVIRLKDFIMKIIKTELANIKRSIIYERKPRNWLKMVINKLLTTKSSFK